MSGETEQKSKFGIWLGRGVAVLMILVALLLVIFSIQPESNSNSVEDAIPQQQEGRTEGEPSQAASQPSTNKSFNF